MSKNVEILGISRSNSYVNGQESNSYKCDILDKDKLKQIMFFFKPDWVFHLAGPAFIPSSLKNPQKTYDTIFQGTLNILEVMRELDIHSRILFVSSADVYGANDKGIIKETEPYDPVNPYSSAKACSELLCKQFSRTYEMDIVIARPFNHTGPGQAKDFVCSNFAYQIAAMNDIQEKKIYTGNIDVKRDFLDVRDVVEAYLKLIDQGLNGEAYNVCSGKETSIRKIIELLFHHANLEKYEIIVDPKKVRQNDIPLRIGDNKKILEGVGWLPQYPIQQTMQDLLMYWKEKQ